MRCVSFLIFLRGVVELGRGLVVAIFVVLGCNIVVCCYHLLIVVVIDVDVVDVVVDLVESRY